VLAAQGVASAEKLKLGACQRCGQTLGLLYLSCARLFFNCPRRFGALCCPVTLRRRWVRACDVDDESAAEAVDPSAAENISVAASSASSVFEKTSRGAQGMSYTGSSTADTAQPVAASAGTSTAAACAHNRTSTQTLSQADGARFWSLAYVYIAAACETCAR
jgi:hypothetical protein